MKKIGTKKIGIIGGAGPLASSLLLENIVHECYVQGCKSEQEFPEIMLLNYPFSITMCVQKTGDEKPIISDVLQACADQLISCGVELLAVACNTFHLFVDGIKTGQGQLVHMVQAVLHEAEHRKLSRLLVLGTPLTLRNSLYRHQGITCVVPLEKDQKFIEHIINRILTGQVLERDSVMLSALIGQLQEKFLCDGVVLGCTELSVLHKQCQLIGESKIVILDPVRILAKKLVQEALNLRKI